MKHSKEKIQEIALEYLKKYSINYIESVPFVIRYNEKEKIRSGIQMDVWTVIYEYMLFESEIAGIVISDETAEVLYVVRKHGYLENEGSR